MSTRTRRRLYWIAGTVVVLGFYFGYSPGPVATVPSLETTHITGPLLPDGRVDYITALNERMGEGVTRENNGIYPLLAVLGPKLLDEDTADRQLAALGLESVPPGPYLPDLEEAFEAHLGSPVDAKAVSKTVWDQLSALLTRPWVDDDAPFVAAWIREHDAMLDQLALAFRSPRLFMPVVAADERSILFESPMLPYGEVRRGAHAIQLRAMHCLGMGDKTEAIADAVTLLHGGRLIRQGSWTLIGVLVGLQFEAMGHEVLHAIIEHGNLDKIELRRIQTALEDLPPAPSVWDVIEHGERWTMLSALTIVGLDGSAATLTQWQGPFRGDMDLNVDFNLVFRRWNRVWDEFLDAVEHAAPAEREAAEAATVDLLERRMPSLDRPGKLIKGVLADPWTRRRLRSEILSDLLVGILMPSFGSFDNTQRRTDARYVLTRTALDLEASRLDHGSYPERLAEPQPIDTFNGQPLIYRRVGAGYVLYSVGPNGVDDGGKSDKFHGDDVVFSLHQAEPDADIDAEAELE